MGQNTRVNLEIKFRSSLLFIEKWPVRGVQATDSELTVCTLVRPRIKCGVTEDAGAIDRG